VVSSFQWQVVFRDSSAGNSSECTSGKNRDESGRVEGVRYDVLDSLAALSDQTLEDLEAEISLIERWKTTHKSSKKPIPDAVTQACQERPECAEMLHTLGTRYENRTFLPNVRDVQRFLARTGSFHGRVRSRREAVRHVMTSLCRLSINDLERLTAASPQADSDFALLAREIMGGGKTKPDG